MSGNFPDAHLAEVPIAPSDEVFRGDYTNQAKIIKDTSLKGLEDKNNTNPKSLDQFDDTTFGVGNTDVFKVLSDEFEGTINNILSQIDDYVSIAQIALKAIQDAIAQDEYARECAQKKYDEVMANDEAYMVSEDANGNPITPYLDEAAQLADAEAAYNAEWARLCWKPGQ